MNTTDHSTVATALRRLADIFDVVDLPGPNDISRCIITDDDRTGIAAINRVCEALTWCDIGHHVDDNGNSYSLTIDCGDGVAYRLFYVYRAAMAAHDARCSYTGNVRIDAPKTGAGA